MSLFDLWKGKGQCRGKPFLSQGHDFEETVFNLEQLKIAVNQIPPSVIFSMHPDLNRLRKSSQGYHD